MKTQILQRLSIIFPFLLLAGGTGCYTQVATEDEREPEIVYEEVEPAPQVDDSTAYYEPYDDPVYVETRTRFYFGFNYYYPWYASCGWSYWPWYDGFYFGVGWGYGAMVRHITPITDGAHTTGGTVRITTIHTIRILHPTDTMGWGTTDTVNLFSIRRAGSTGQGIPGMSERQGCGVRTGA